jgi:hypothetical protein
VAGHDVPHLLIPAALYGANVPNPDALWIECGGDRYFLAIVVSGGRVPHLLATALSKR